MYVYIHIYICIYIYRSTEESDIMYSILGLNLLYLLVENRLADFHCEVRYTYIYIYMYKYTYVCICMCMYIWIYIDIFVYIHLFIYIYIYIVGVANKDSAGAPLCGLLHSARSASHGGLL
jgi:hypothetical protein